MTGVEVGFAIEMLVAILATIRFMKVGFMAQQATGWELGFAMLAGALALLFTGAGSVALDPTVGL